jgi:hypothetical protein
VPFCDAFGVMDERFVDRWADRLRREVPEAVAVLLGGSHAHGDAGPHSDVDFDVLVPQGLRDEGLAWFEVAGERLVCVSAWVRDVGAWLAAQEQPQEWAFLVLGAHLNPRWDEELARGRIERLDLVLGQKAGKLSGGQRAQLALTLAVAKRPELLILDAPVASLDPLARREFLQDLMEAIAEQDLSVVLSAEPAR